MADEDKPQSAVEHVLKHSQHKRNTGYVLIKLAQCMDAGNNCPSHKDLADMTGLSKSTIQGALGELEKDNTIERTKNGGAKVRGGYTTCYRLAGHKPVTPKGTPPESKPVESVQDKSVEPETVIQESTLTPDTDKHETPEAPPPPLAPAHEGEFLNTSTTSPEKEKDKDSLLSAKADKSPAPPAKISRLEYDDLILAIGEAFEAFDKEAQNYYNMLTGRAKKDGWIQPIFQTAPMLAPELRAWSRWHRQKQQGAAHVKKPEKVASSVAEYRRIQATRPQNRPVHISPPRPFGMLTEAEKNAFRLAQHGVMPFELKGSTP